MTDTTRDVSRDVSAIADAIGDLVRTSNRNRTHALAKQGEWSDHILLKTLATEGPLRASVLAEHLNADPSTISRQVATLVRDGLLERRSDQEDGRASLLVPTPAGDDLLRSKAAARDERFADMLSQWSPGDLHTLAVLLGRLQGDYQAAASRWLASRQTAEVRA